MKNNQLQKPENSNRIFWSALLLASSLLINGAVSADVLSTSPIYTSERNGDPSYEEVSVSCSTKRVRPILIKQSSDQPWCDSALTNICHQDKLSAAAKVCLLSYSKALKIHTAKTGATKANNTAQKAKPQSKTTIELHEELFQIEQSLIDIKTAYLKLRKKELQLVASKN